MDINDSVQTTDQVKYYNKMQGKKMLKLVNVNTYLNAYGKFL